MSSARAERLVNLVLCLLSARQYLTAERIRSIVPGYDRAPSDEAFFRMFERDKAELRDLGIPMETGTSAFETAEGYRIARRDYELPDIDLEPDEATAVALAARLWDGPDLSAAAHGALRKLRAAGIEVDDQLAAVQPHVRASEPAFGPLVAAVQDGRAVTFLHRRKPGTEPTRRHLEPWGVVSWRGRWYVVGHDQDRDATRSFRLSRITSEVSPAGPPGAVRRPDNVDLLAIVSWFAEPAPTPLTATLWLAENRAHGLRRGAEWLRREYLGDQPGDVVRLQLNYPDTAARWIAGHGPDAVVLEPAELADAVTDLLTGSLHRHRPRHQEHAGGSTPVPQPVGRGS